MRRRLVVSLVLALALVIGGAAHGAQRGDFALRGVVAHVVDGDTIDVRLDAGRRERVRLIGIDTPEVGECGYRRASTAARALALRRRVVLRGDATQSTRDRYGRLLAYAWLEGGRDLGFQLLIRGDARVYVYDRAFVRLAAYRRAERLGSGRRASCAVPPSRRCDPSYPGVCIPSPPPDLDCRDIEHRRFRVVGADPHRFDGDHDGVGCER